MRADPFDTVGWPWVRGDVRLLPVLHGRIETARAVRAHLDEVEPEVVVLEIPSPLAAAFVTAVEQLPSVFAVRADTGSGPRWLLVEPADGIVEAARWALEHGARIVCADLFVPDYREHRDAVADPVVIPEIGYRAYVRAFLAGAGARGRGDVDRRREQALATAIEDARTRGLRAVAVLGLAHLAGVLDAEARSGVIPMPFARPRAIAPVPVDPACLVELFAEAPFVAAAWERARRGRPPAPYAPPPRADHRPEPPDGPPGADPGPASGDPLARPALFYRLVRHAGRLARETGGVEPGRSERRVLHRFATRLARLHGRLCPDLYELVVAARGAVDDAFARDLIDLAGYWPFGEAVPGAVRLSSADIGRDSRLVRLRPRIDRLSARRSMARALERLASMLEDRPTGICSHLPEDVVVEGLGARVRQVGSLRASRGGERSLPFVASLHDGLDARETLRRYLVDGRPWVREELPARATVGAVVVIFDEGRTGEREEFPWCQVWHGEHDDESDMAFYASDPQLGRVAPGIHRAEYGGFLLIWPRLRLGDIWHDPAYRFTRSKAERLIVAGLDYSREPLVACVAARPPRAALSALARRLGRRLVHVPAGTFPPDLLRRVRRFHVLADKRLRPLAEHLIDPTPRG